MFQSRNKQVFFLVLLLLLVACTMLHAQEVSFRTRTRAFSLEQAEIYQILSYIFNELILSIIPTELYYAGRSWTGIVRVASREVTVRIWFFNARNGLGGGRSCAVNPAWTEVMRGQRMRIVLASIYEAVARQAFIGRYGHIAAVLRNLGIEYSARGRWTGSASGQSAAPYKRSTMLKALPPAVEAEISSLELDEGDDDDNCFVYTTCLLSGEDGALGSFLSGGSELVSQNALYKLVMQTDCNLVLYFVGSAGLTPIWASKTQNKATGCTANLQMDGNLVIVDYTGVNVVWATNVYCQPQPDCVITTGLVVQDDGNLVIYDTDKVEALWSAF